MDEKNKLTNGPILKSLVLLSIPIIFANLLQTAYQLTDTFWVGRLGAEAVASVSISFPLLFLILSLGGGLTMAGTILVAQFKGKGDRRAVDHITSQTMMVVITVSIILSALGYLISPWAIGMMGAGPEVFDSSVLYLRISLIGMIFMFTFMVFQSLMRGIGDVKTPMYIVLGTVILNLVLDPLFIFGYGPIEGRGVAGAAIATIFTQSIAALIGVVILIRGKRMMQMRFRDMIPDLPLIKKMFSLGLPASIEQSARALGMTVMTTLVASFGTLTLAAYGIGSRIISFIIIPALGLAMSTSALVGQNIGAGKIDRAEKISWLSARIGFISLTIVGIVMFIFAEGIASIFIPGETQAISISAGLIRIISLSFGFIGIHMALNGALMGSGNTMTTMIMTIVSIWVLQYPLALILSKLTPLAQTGIWLAFPIANVIGAIIVILWFRRGSWKKKKITEEISMSKATVEETIIEEGMN